MEENEEFQKIVATISQLEELKQSVTKLNEKYGIQIEGEIVEQFASCVNALAAKKVSIMKDLSQEIIQQQKAGSEKCVEIDQALEFQRKILETGALIYKAEPKTALQIWKSAATLTIPKVNDPVKLNLPVSMLHSIQAQVEAITLHTPELKEEHPENLFSVAEDTCTFAGSAYGMKEGKRLNARFSGIRGLCWNPHDSCLYVCDKFNNSIRRVTHQGEVTTFVNGLDGPHDIAMHFSSSTYFVTNQNAHSIIKIESATGKLEVHAGGTKGYQDGKGPQACFNSPRGIAIDQLTGTLYVTDTENNVIRKITSQGEVTTLAGSGESGHVDGNGKQAKFYMSWGIMLDSEEQCLFVCDYFSNKIRRVSMTGEVTTLCDLHSPAFITCANRKYFLVSGYDDHIMYVVSRQGTVKSLEIKGKGDTKLEYEAISPTGLAFSDSRTCFVAALHQIRKISF